MTDQSKPQTQTTEPTPPQDRKGDRQARPATERVTGTDRGRRVGTNKFVLQDDGFDYFDRPPCPRR